MNTYTEPKRKSKNRSKVSTKLDFFTEFAVETDIFTDERLFPDWIFYFREEHLTKLSNPMKKLCRNLKSLGVEFKIKYPIKILDKWKFADIYIPKTKTVILVLSSYKEDFRPIGVTPDRSLFFKDMFKVIELYEYNVSDIEILKKRLKLH